MIDDSEIMPDRPYSLGKTEPCGAVECPMKQSLIAELRCWQIQSEVKCRCPNRVTEYRARELQKVMRPEYHKGPSERSLQRLGRGKLLEG